MWWIRIAHTAVGPGKTVTVQESKNVTVNIAIHRRAFVSNTITGQCPDWFPRSPRNTTLPKKRYPFPIPVSYNLIPKKHHAICDYPSDYSVIFTTLQGETNSRSTSKAKERHAKAAEGADTSVASAARVGGSASAGWGATVVVVGTAVVARASGSATSRAVGLSNLTTADLCRGNVGSGAGGTGLVSGDGTGIVVGTRHDC